MQEGFGMFYWQRPRRLPPEIQLEVEMLISDLRGGWSVARQDAQKGAGEARATDGLSRRAQSTDTPADARFLRPRRRLLGGPRNNDRR
jgi:hypothetical protein